MPKEQQRHSGTPEQGRRARTGMGMGRREKTTLRIGPELSLGKEIRPHLAEAPGNQVKLGLIEGDKRGLYRRSRRPRQ